MGECADNGEEEIDLRYPDLGSEDSFHEDEITRSSQVIYLGSLLLILVTSTCYLIVEALCLGACCYATTEKSLTQSRGLVSAQTSV